MRLVSTSKHGIARPQNRTYEVNSGSRNSPPRKLPPTEEAGSTRPRISQVTSFVKGKVKANKALVVSLSFVLFYSYLPLLLNPSHYPPGQDTTKLQVIVDSGSLTHTYLGFLPMYLSTSLYYYSTFLLMFVGLWFFLKDYGKWTPFLAWFLLLFLVPTIYINMVAGAWITNVGFFLVGLTAFKLMARWFQDERWLIIAAPLAFLAPVFHTETGGYFVIGILTYMGLTFRRNWIRIHLAIPMVLGLGISALFLSSSVNYVKDVITTTPLVSSPGKEVGAPKPKNTIFGPKTYAIVNPERGGIDFITEPELQRVLAEIKEFGESSLSYRNEPVYDIIIIRTSSPSYWVNNLLTPTLIPLVVITTFSILVLYTYKVPLRLNQPTILLVCAIPAMILFTFTPWEINAIRIGIHLVSITCILLAIGITLVWKNLPDNRYVHWIILGTISYYAAINLPNSLHVWLTAYA